MLHEFQTEVLQELLDDTLNKAARSMEKMLKVRIQHDLLGFGAGMMDRIPELDPLGRFKVHVVKIPLKGEIKGAFYFIINSHETELINSVCLPESINSNLNKKKENVNMQVGFISEVNNLITSISLTEISSFLGVQLIAQVPQFHVLQGQYVNDYLESENRNVDCHFYLKSSLSGVVVNISPYFLWMLDNSFIDKLNLNIVT